MAQGKDPDGGITIDDKDAAATSEYRSRYYFGSQECKTSFDQNPAKYAGQT